MDITKTLDELDPPPWGEPEYNSYLVTTSHRLRKKPIGEFDVEDLRIMIGQDIGSRWLVPLAVDVLERNPLAEGDFYPGDLFANILRLPKEFWQDAPALHNRVATVLHSLPVVPEELAEAVAAFQGAA